MEFVFLIIFVLLLLPGIAMTMVPALPALLYLFAVAAVFAFLGKLQVLSGNELLILGALALVSAVVDYAAGILGAKYGGASRKALVWGFIGLVVGSILFFPFGGIAGLALGVLVAELAQQKTRERAVRAAAGSLLGAIAGIAINFFLAVVFVVLCIVFAWQ